MSEPTVTMTGHAALLVFERYVTRKRAERTETNRKKCEYLAAKMAFEKDAEKRYLARRPFSRTGIWDGLAGRAAEKEWRASAGFNLALEPYYDFHFTGRFYFRPFIDETAEEIERLYESMGKEPSASYAFPAHWVTRVTLEPKK